MDGDRDSDADAPAPDAGGSDTQDTRDPDTLDPDAGDSDAPDPDAGDSDTSGPDARDSDGWDPVDHDEASTEPDDPLDRRFLTPLREAVAEHRTYVLFSAGLFLLGAVIGAAMVGRVDLWAVLGVEDARQLFPENVTAVTILLNNTRAAVVLVLGALSLGVVTALVLLFNGILVGYVAGLAAAERGVGVVLLAILPHGVIELPAIFVAGAVAFRVVHVTALRVIGRREAVLGMDGWRRAGILLGTAWLALVVAAIVEFYVTKPLVDAVAG